MQGSTRRVRLGIVGLGGMGMNHLRNALTIPEVELAAVCDTDPARTARAGSMVGSSAPGRTPVAFTRYEDLMVSGLVDAVLVATPHFQHVPVALAAFDHGLHVLTEKPIAVHVEDARRVIEGHERALRRSPGLLFAAMFQMRTLGVWRKLKEMLEAGELGRIIRATWIVTDWFRSQAYFANGWRGTWKGDGGGVLMNQSPHQLDLFWWLFGLPSRVHGFAAFGKYHDIEVEDEVSAYLEYADGRIGHFVTSTAESPGSNRLEVAGEMGRIVVEGEAIRYQRNAQSTTDFISSATEPFRKLAFAEVPVMIVKQEGSPHRAVLANFAEAILGGAKILAPAAEGIHSVMLANAIILSALQRAPVDMPLKGGELSALLAARGPAGANR